MTDARDAIFAKALVFLQSGAADERCFALLVGPDFCVIVAADTKEALATRARDALLDLKGDA